MTIRSIISDFIDTTFNLDKGFIYTLRNLLKQPGIVAQNFIDGKRKRFTNPVKYLFVATAIQALVEYLFMYKEQGIPFRSYPFLSNQMNQNMHLWNETLTLDYPILFGVVNLLFWPVPLFFLFKKLKYNYSELIVAMMYFYGTMIILIELTAMIHNPIAKRNIPIELVVIITTVYTTYSLFGFYKIGSISWRIPRIVKAILIIFAFRMFILPFTLSWFSPFY